MRVSSMAQSFYHSEQAERCRRLARGSIDEDLRFGLLRLANEYIAGANALENDGKAVRRTGSDDDCAA
jgi:hypothetical protein